MASAWSGQTDGHIKRKECQCNSRHTARHNRTKSFVFSARKRIAGDHSLHHLLWVQTRWNSQARVQEALFADSHKQSAHWTNTRIFVERLARSRFHVERPKASRQIKTIHQRTPSSLRYLFYTEAAGGVHFLCDAFLAPDSCTLQAIAQSDRNNSRKIARLNLMSWERWVEGQGFAEGSLSCPLPSIRPTWLTCPSLSLRVRHPEVQRTQILLSNPAFASEETKQPIKSHKTAEVIIELVRCILPWRRMPSSQNLTSLTSFVSLQTPHTFQEERKKERK